MISSSVNMTLSSALQLWQVSSAAASSTGAKTTTPSTAASRLLDIGSSANASIDQIFAILHAAHRQAGPSNSARSVSAAYASETISTPTASLRVSASITTVSPSTQEQINSAVSQVNASLKTFPSNTGGVQVTASDAYVVSVGSAPVSTRLDLPAGLSKPTTIAEALQQLSQSGNAGVAAAAKDIMPRFVAGIPLDGGWGYYSSATEIAAAYTNTTPVIKAVLTFLSTDRDNLITDLAMQMITTGAQSSSYQAGLLSATYNGSFTMINLGTKDPISSNPGGAESDTLSYAGTVNSDNTQSYWALVVPTSTTTVTTTIEAAVKSDTSNAKT